MKEIKVIIACAASLTAFSILMAQTGSNPASNPRDNPDALSAKPMAQPRVSPAGGTGPLTTPGIGMTPSEGLSSVVPSPSATFAPTATPTDSDVFATATPH